MSKDEFIMTRFFRRVDCERGHHQWYRSTTGLYVCRVCRIVDWSPHRRG